MGSFDVFFSYATRDHAVVERVARDLTQQGIRVFLDRWYLTPGQPWPQALERTLAACGAAAVFIGDQGLGPWQQRERDLALDRQAREPDFPVIPILLTRGDPALGLLKLNTWIDLSTGGNDDETLSVLAAAIRREPPEPLARKHIQAIRAAVCPYRGLRPFREEDEPFFFGRNTFAETLTAVVLRQPCVAVVGASGSGKSSVVRAGLIPRLRHKASSLVWDAITLVPTDRPFISLAAVLQPALEPDLSEVDRLAEVGKLAAHLQDGTVAVQDVAGRVLEKQPGTDRLLLFIDQWEELYTLCDDEIVRRTFIDHLLNASATDAVHVVLTLRGDFMGQALGNRDLADRLQDGVVTIGPMTREELDETIVRPAEKTGLTFELGLPETILEDVGNEPGGLPLLEFLLQGLWAERSGTVLTLDAYSRLGRVSGAIAHRAENIFKERLSEVERQAAQRLLMRMVRPGEGVEDTRRRVALTDADAVADATIQKLAQERLVVTERDSGTGQVTVEVAHEALIRRWQRFRTWIDADREFLRTRERIAVQARLWHDENRSRDRLLPPGRALAEGEDLLTNRGKDLENLLIEYINASAEAARRKEESRRAAQRRHLQTARLTAAAMAILALVAMGGGVIAWWQRGEANRNAEMAQYSQSRAFAALADAKAKSGSPATAARAALAGVPPYLAKPDRSYAAQAVEAVRTSLQRLQELRRLGHDDPVVSVDFSPDGRMLAAASGSGGHLWDMATGAKIQAFRVCKERVTSVAFSPDGRTLAIACGSRPGVEECGVWLAEVATGEETGARCGYAPNTNIKAIDFSPDGRMLAGISSGPSYPSVDLWDLATGATIRTFRNYKWGMYSLAFSSDGRMLATAGAGLTSTLWEVATGKRIKSLSYKHDEHSVAFSPNGRMLAIASPSYDETGLLMEVETDKDFKVLEGHDAPVNSVAFGPDGRVLATGSDDNTARLWSVYNQTEIVALRGHEKAVRSLAFSPDGRVLATGSDDNTARLWKVVTGEEIVFSGDNTDRWAAVDLQRLIDYACARVHYLPLSKKDSQRFGIEVEWCSPKVSGALRAKLALDHPQPNIQPDDRAGAGAD